MLKRLLAIVALLSFSISPAWADEYTDTINVFKKAVESGAFFQKSHGYAVFPTIGKGGVGVGGAYGKGRLYKQGKHIGDVSMTQLTVGFQLGGEAFSEIIFFENEAALKKFTDGNFRRAHEIVQGSNAFQIGLRQGDRFVEINGTTVQTGRDIAEGMEAWHVGDPLRFVVERDGKRVVLEGVFQPIEVDVPPAPIFPRKRPSGRVDLVRQGNVVDASTEGVRAFTLLLSPSVFDFRRPIRVVANGRPVFDGLVEPSVATMLKWAARDNDRTMLFGAELNIDLGR